MDDSNHSNLQLKCYQQSHCRLLRLAICLTTCLAEQICFTKRFVLLNDLFYRLVWMIWLNFSENFQWNVSREPERPERIVSCIHVPNNLLVTNSAFTIAIHGSIAYSHNRARGSSVCAFSRAENKRFRSKFLAFVQTLWTLECSVYQTHSRLFWIQESRSRRLAMHDHCRIVHDHRQWSPQQPKQTT